jgi:hypothetical protein
MKISELKPVTKTYTQFKLDGMDTPTEVKDILNSHMAFGHVSFVNKTVNDGGFFVFKIEYVKNIKGSPADFEINSADSRILKVIVNDYNKQTTALVYITDTLATNINRIKFIKESDHETFLLPLTKEDYPNGYSN